MSRSSAAAAGLGGAWKRLPAGPRCLALGLAGWIAAVAALAGGELVGDDGAGTGPAPGPGLAAASVGPSLAAITERPLFSPSRRPDAPPPVTAPPSAAPPAPFRDRQIGLKGVYINGGEAKAFVTSAANPEGLWVARGSAVGGWQVSSVSAGQIRLEAEGETLLASMNPAAGRP